MSQGAREEEPGELETHACGSRHACCISCGPMSEPIATTHPKFRHRTVAVLPWLVALVVGAASQIGWLVHEKEHRGVCATPIVVQAPPQVVFLPDAESAGEPAQSQDLAAPAYELLDGSQSSGEAKRGVAGASSAIACDGDRCEVDLAFTRSLWDNPAFLARQARWVPVHGSPGFKVYAIRKGSPADLLGFKNGDLITTINGEPLDRGWGQVIDLVETLDQEEVAEIKVGVKRRGRSLTKEIVVR